jgi:hypothetical protein
LCGLWSFVEAAIGNCFMTMSWNKGQGVWAWCSLSWKRLPSVSCSALWAVCCHLTGGKRNWFRSVAVKYFYPQLFLRRNDTQKRE